MTGRLRLIPCGDRARGNGRDISTDGLGEVGSPPRGHASAAGARVMRRKRA